MTKKIIHPFRFNKTVRIPASKSHLQRLLALASLCPHTSSIHNIHLCDDVKAALSIIQEMGACVHFPHPETVDITGISLPTAKKSVQLNVQESGLCARMFGLIAPALFDEVHIVGINSILHRSMESLISVLKQAGCSVDSHQSHLPLRIKGRANYERIYIENTDTSQIITGIIYASLVSKKNAEITITKPPSIPYIQLSVETARAFGVNIMHADNYQKIFIPAHQTIKPVTIYAEGDWSNAAFFLVAAALSGVCEVVGLNRYSAQGDKAIVNILRECGAEVRWTQENTLIVEQQPLRPLDVDLSPYPDLFPPLCVLAIGIRGKSVLRGISRLQNKESNRAEALVQEFSKLGADINIHQDAMIVHGKGLLKGGEVHTHNDHRMAMAAAVSACISEAPVIIQDAEVVKKSYPAFFDDLEGSSTNP